MPKLTDVRFHINRDTFEFASVCTIHYSYCLECAAEELDSSAHFTVWVEVWGKGTLSNMIIGDITYDSHNPTLQNQQQVSRQFGIPCELLNEALGKDRLFLKVCLTSNLGIDICCASPVLEDSF